MWLLFSIISYFFFAVAGIFDRLVLVGSPVRSKRYAFYVGILSGIIGCIFLPVIGFRIPEFSVLFIALATGIVWVFFLWAVYECVFQAGISRTAPVIGGLIPIFTLGIGFTLFGQEVLLPHSSFFAFLLLIIAAVLFSRKESAGKSQGFSSAVLLLMIGTSALFGLYLVLSKVVFEKLPFLEGFTWMRIGTLAPVIFFLFSKDTRNGAAAIGAISQKQFLIPFIAAQFFGGLGVLLQQLSLFWANVREVALVPALVGAQYVFLYGAMILLYRWRPELLKEAMGGRALQEKVFAAAFVILGLFILILNK